MIKATDLLSYHHDNNGYILTGDNVFLCQEIINSMLFTQKTYKKNTFYLQKQQDYSDLYEKATTSDMFSSDLLFNVVVLKKPTKGLNKILIKTLTNSQQKIILSGKVDEIASSKIDLSTENKIITANLLGTKNWVDSWLEYFILQNSLEFKTKETKQWILKELKDSPHIIKSWITKLIFESNISKITPEHLKTLDIYSLHEDAKQVIIYALNGNVFKCINAVKNMHTSNNSSYGLLIWLTFRFLYCIIELKYTNRNILNNLFLPKNCDDKLLYIAKKISEKNIKKYMSQIEEVDRFNKQANNSSKLVGLLELYKNIAMT